MALPQCILTNCCIITLHALSVIPKTTTVSTHEDRSFAAIAPKLWNQLLLAIRQSNCVDGFKRALKTYLFRQSSFFSCKEHRDILYVECVF